MIPTVDFSALKQARWYQFALRFALGGAITAATGLVARHWGPVIGGLFLSFPAIFPASATLLERHQSRKKQQAGIRCQRRGRKRRRSMRPAQFSGAAVWLLLATSPGAPSTP